MMRRNGFTFIELLVVITIIGVVFAAGIVSYTTISRNSRDARRVADMEAIRQALEMCRSIAGEYPSTIYPESGSIICADTAGSVMLKSTPIDPKPCISHENGEYSFSATEDTYTLTADCMENASRTNEVTNP
jgi:prepilin-type N-terminal cleavage/methylation domain-containing protein